LLLGLGLSGVVRPCTLLPGIVAIAGQSGDKAEVTDNHLIELPRLADAEALKLAAKRFMLLVGAGSAALQSEMLPASNCMICKA
jgi:hypothetical protein